MSMSRSDYEMIVECLTSVPKDSILDKNTQHFYYHIVSNFIQHLSADNNRFDRNKFLDALDDNGWNRIDRWNLPIYQRERLNRTVDSCFRALQRREEEE